MWEARVPRGALGGGMRIRGMLDVVHWIEEMIDGDILRESTIGCCNFLLFLKKFFVLFLVFKGEGGN